ncbi:MAG: HDOD domain-containing protein [Planctomycetaceae bacterium]
MSTLIEPVEAGTVALPAAVVERLRSRANNLKMLPAVATQALQIVEDPECGINEFAAVVERDPSLAAGILRMANSVVFSSGRPVLNLHQAVVRLGFRQCKNLIVTASFSSMMKSMTLDEEWIRETLSQHSFTTALLCLNMNRTLNIGFQGEEFTGGLIHDIGRLLLATCYSDCFSELDKLEFDEEIGVLAAEQALVETNHCEIGAWFVTKNALPEQLKSVVRFHHNPELADTDSRRFVALVAVCDHMANHLQRYEESRGYDPASNPFLATLEASGTQSLARRFYEVANTMMEDARKHSIEMLSA